MHHVAGCAKLSCKPSAGCRTVAWSIVADASFSGVTLIAALGRHVRLVSWPTKLARALIAAVRPRTAAWHGKSEPTFSDAIAAVRRAL